MKTTMKKIRSQYRELTRQLGRLGWIARGNLFRRFLVRKVGGKDKKYGPYYLLTRSQEGHTVTHALNRPQFQLYSQAIANHHRANQTLKQMRKLTVQYIQCVTPKLPSRKRSEAP